MDHATLGWILTQPHLTVRQMDILTVLQNVGREVKHIPCVKNQMADAMSHHPDCRWERCNSLPQEVTAAREWIDDMEAGIVDDEWFGPIARSLANPRPSPPPSTALTKESKSWVSARQFYLGENGLLWLCQDLEKKQVEKKTKPRKKDEEEGVEITVRTN